MQTNEYPSQVGDGQNFDEVYRFELPTMVRLATFILGSQPVAEEAVHDAFLKLHQRWFEIENPGGFLRTTVVNRCKDLRRREKVSNRHLRLVEGSMDTEPAHHYLVDALQKLEFKRRTIVVLRFYGDYKLGEIAEMMSIPEATVSSNIRRGLQELKEALSQ